MVIPLQFTDLAVSAVVDFTAVSALTDVTLILALAEPSKVVDPVALPV